MSGDEASSRVQASSESVGVPIAGIAAPIAGQDEMLRTLATAMQQIVGNAPPRQSSVIKEIHEYRAKEFSDEKLQCATALLKEEARRWWASVARATPPERMTWDFFLNKFRDCYVGEKYMDDRRQEFQLLVQGRMTGGLVGLETSDLTKLSHAARNLEQLKISEKVEEGSMNQEKRQAESSHSASRGKDSETIEVTEVQRLVDSKVKEQVKCQSLGQGNRQLQWLVLEDQTEECPRGQVSSGTGSAPGAQRGRGTGRGFVAARGHRPISEPIQKPTSRAPSRAYAMRTHEDSDAPDVILGTFILFDVPVIALIDPGSTHSYICDKLLEEHSLPLEKTKYDILVSNPLGMSVVVNRVYRNCPLNVQGCLFLANLMELPFREFDIILGMDWLYVHRALVDCGKKGIILYALDGHEVIVVGERSDYLDNVISATTARKLVGKGCEAYLAYILDTRAEDPKTQSEIDTDSAS
ncbi:hypothetical protein SASPL_145286 [Salvia splendens]|uniref:Retrotransposon gag domain-containing protein n=1 Tax=Salvia splendens TaxID=180675 RepID=A0A8X8WIS4_SALSN|nr:hypothetical protein SASPL_145286 [Salvia splendens]